MDRREDYFLLQHIETTYVNIISNASTVGDRIDFIRTLVDVYQLSYSDYFNDSTWPLNWLHILISPLEQDDLINLLRLLLRKNFPNYPFNHLLDLIYAGTDKIEFFNVLFEKASEHALESFSYSYTDKYAINAYPLIPINILKSWLKIPKTEIYNILAPTIKDQEVIIEMLGLNIPDLAKEILAFNLQDKAILQNLALGDKPPMVIRNSIENLVKMDIDEAFLVDVALEHFENHVGVVFDIINYIHKAESIAALRLTLPSKFHYALQRQDYMIRNKMTYKSKNSASQN